MIDLCKLWLGIVNGTSNETETFLLALNYWELTTFTQKVLLLLSYEAQLE